MNRFSSLSRRHKLLVVGACGLLAGAILFVRMFWPEPSLPNQAKDLFEAAIRGNAEAVSRSIPEQDLQRMGINRGVAKRAIEECVLPRLTRCKLLRSRSSISGDHDLSGTWVCDVRMPDGTVHQLGCQVQRSDHGSVVPFIMWLHYAWAEQYFESHPGSNTVPVESLAVGLGQDRGKLLNSGITKVVDIHNNVVGVDDLLTTYQRRNRSDASGIK